MSVTSSSRQQRLQTILTERFTPTAIEVVDDSARHEGHAGAAGGGGTHFSVWIVASAFDGLSRVERSRAVHEALAGEFDSGLHALSLTLKSPGEVK